jgi:hypothetical protein
MASSGPTVPCLVTSQILRGNLSEILEFVNLFPAAATVKFWPGVWEKKRQPAVGCAHQDLLVLWRPDSGVLALVAAVHDDVGIPN